MVTNNDLLFVYVLVKSEISDQGALGYTASGGWPVIFSHLMTKYEFTIPVLAA